MQTYKIWEGTRTFLPGDASEYKVTEIIAEELGWFEDVNPDGVSGSTYYVYRTLDDEIIVQIDHWTSEIGGLNRGEVFRFRSLEDAAQNGQRYALSELRLI